MKFRPRFSLRILLLAIAVIAVFCGYHIYWIRQRHNLLARHAARSAEIYKLLSGDNEAPILSSDNQALRSRNFGPEHFYPWTANFPRKTSKSTFNFLWLFGEPRQETILLTFPYVGDHHEEIEQGISTEETNLAERLFPEADIQYRIYDLK